MYKNKDFAKSTKQSDTKEPRNLTYSYTYMRKRLFESSFKKKRSVNFYMN